MRNCPRCGLDGDEQSFYPDPKQKWCRSCVEEFVANKHQRSKPKAQRMEREQKAIRDLVTRIQKERNVCFVYLIQGTGGYKIGFSSDVGKRASQLNTSLSHTCRIIAVAPGDQKLERSLHHRHRFKRINREWFTISSHILRDFTQLDGALVFLPGFLSPEDPTKPSSVNGEQLNE